MRSRRHPLSQRPGSLPAQADRRTSEPRLRVPEVRASEARLRAASGRPPEGISPATQLARVRAILRSYLSPIMVDSVLEKAMSERGVSPRQLNGAELAEVTSDMMIGLRLFVPGDRLPQLMMELVEVLEGGTP